MKLRRMMALLLVCIQMISCIPVGFAGVEGLPPATEPPAASPTEPPAQDPTEPPAPDPTEVPTPKPTEEPEPDPTEAPTPKPTEAPTAKPTEAQTPKPTEEPTSKPTEEPTSTHTSTPAATPTTTAASAADATATPIVTSTPTPVPNAFSAPAPSAERFGQNIAFEVIVDCTPSNADGSAEAVVALQREVGESMENLADPARPLEDYTVSIMLDEDGQGSAEFSMTGFLVNDVYHARLVSYNGISADSSDSGYSVTYRDGEPEELTTKIKLKLKAASKSLGEEESLPTATPTADPNATPTADPNATPTADPNATPTADPNATPTADPTATPTADPNATPTIDPTATPTADPNATPTADPSATPTPDPNALPEAYGADAFYVFSVSLDAPLDNKTVTAALTDAEGQALETQVVELNDELTASASFALEGKPTQAVYTARVLELNGLPIAETEAQGMSVRYEDEGLRTDAYVTSQPLFAAPMMMSMRAMPMLLASVNESWTLTLSIALNGNNAAPVQIPISIALTETPTSDILECVATTTDGIAAIRVTEKTAESVTFTVAPAGLAGLDYTVNVKPNGECTVTQSRASDKYALAEGFDDEWTDVFDDSAATAAFGAMELKTFTGTLNWNDNNDAAGKRPENPAVVLERTTDPSGGAWDTVDSTTAPDKSSYNTWEYAYTLLPKNAPDGSLYTYRLREDAGTASDYLVTHEDDGETIKNTLKAAITVTKQWNDIGAPEGFRPSSSTWLEGVTLSRDSAPLLNQIRPSDLTGTDGDVWTLTVSGLPAFGEDGLPYEYTIKDSVSEEPAANGDYYESIIENVGEKANRTDVAYDGGRLISTVKANDVFRFTKVWKDGDLPADQRPDVVFYLFRFTEDSTLEFDPGRASPVNGMDKMSLGNKASGVEHTYEVNNNSSLPRYDETGRRYVYFLTEKIGANTHDYVMSVENGAASHAAEATDDQCILNGGTVTNKSTATDTPSVTKTWHAKAIQGMQASVTMQLYRRSAQAGSALEAVPESDGGMREIDNFTAERMSQTKEFRKPQSRYDDEGYLYTYTVREIGAEVNGVSVTGLFEAGSTFTAGGYTFRVSYDEANRSVTNTLIGDAKLRVRKNWSPDLNEEASITIRILQNGVLYRSYEADQVTSNPSSGVVYHADGSVTISGTGDFSVLFSHLPRYDAAGSEYTYTVEEVSTSNGDYRFSNLTYSMEREGGEADSELVKTATITNITTGDGPSIDFEIHKNWLDDNDMLHRVPVTANIYYDDPADSGAPVLIRSVTLTADNSWYQHVSYALTEDATVAQRDYANYTVREESYGDSSSTSNNWMSVGEYTTDASGSLAASAETKEHLYAVSIQRDGGRYTITNLRVGKLRIDLSKTWAVGDMSGLEAHFQLYREGNPVSGDAGARTLTQGGATNASFDGLDKYNAKGELIAYTVKETSLQYADDPATLEGFVNGELVMPDPTDQSKESRIVSSYSQGVYTIGAQHTNDVMPLEFTNQRSDSAQLYINKVWRDQGPGNTKRPDIVLELSRKSAGQAEAEAETVRADRLWNTALNDWFWRCGFGEVARYDAAGHEYEYMVKEKIVQADSSKYAASYYNGPDQPNENAENTKDTFSATGDVTIGYAKAGFSEDTAGTIINTLSDSMIFKGRKLWLNLPAWFKIRDLPDIYVQLYRSTDGTKDYNETTKYGEHKKLEKGESSYQFPAVGAPATDHLPLYDEFGNPYTYYVREENEDGASLLIDGYAYNADGGVVTNTYVKPPIVPATPVLVEITVTKKWDWVNRQGHHTHYPDVFLTLSRRWTNGESTHTEEIYTERIEGGSIPTDDTIVQPSHTFTSANTGKALLRYAPDGQPYEYSVEERAVAGYTTAYEGTGVSGKTPSGAMKATVQLTQNATDEYLFEGSATFKNTYDPEELTSIKAIKIWDDDENEYGTRPDIKSATHPVVFKLFRRIAGSAGTETEITSSVSATWTELTTAGKPWECEFSPIGELKLYKHDTNGRLYEYYVEEEPLTSPYDEHYPEGLRTEAGLSVTNRLDTVNLYVDKQWKDTDGIADLSVQQLIDLHAIGAIGDELRFAVEQSTDNGTTWVPTPDENTPDADDQLIRTIGWDALLNAVRNDKLLSIAARLPRFDHEGTEYQYRVKEVVEGDPLYAVSEPVVNGTTSTITNTFQTRKLYFAKDWLDDTNREGSRPAELEITVTRTSASGNATTAKVKLTKDTESTDPKKLQDGHGAPSPDDGTRWLGEITVPAAGAYTAAETVPAGYTQMAGSPETDTTVTSDTGSSYAWWGFSNEHPSKLTTKTIAITATKAWSDDDDAYGDRPASVTLTLERKPASKTNSGWGAIPDGDGDFPVGVERSQVLSPRQTETWASNTVKATWAGLPVYQNKTDSDANTVVYSYRVMETPLRGYTVQAAPATVDALIVNGTTTKEQAVVVTNTVKTTKLDVDKIWDDGNTTDSIARRPTTITVNLQRRLATSANDADWANVMKNGSADTLTLNATGLWKGTFNKLPTHSKNGEAYAYRAVEAEPPADYLRISETTAAGKTTITNKLQIVNVYAAKAWTDQNGTLSADQMSTINDLGGLPSVTFKAQRRENDTDNWVDVPDVAPKQFTGADIIAKLKGSSANEPYLIAENQPRYVAGTEIPYQYRVVESIANNSYTSDWTVPSSNAIPAGEQGEIDDYTIKFTTSLTNEIDTRTLYFVKNWDDECDRDGARPDSLSLTITRKIGAETGKLTALTLDATKTETSDPKETDDGHGLPSPNDGTRWLGELLVPASGTYSAQESALTNGYSLSEHEHTEATTADGAYDWWSFTNTRPIKKISLTMTKSWNGGGKDELYGDRPESVFMTLERKLATADEDAWVTLTTTSPDLPTGYQPTREVRLVNGIWSAKWENLPAYRSKATSSLPPKAYSYRVVEAAHAGYAVAYGPAVNAAADGIEKTITVENTLKTVRLAVSKSWADDATVARPSAIKVKLQRRIANTTTPNEWSDVSVASDATGAPVIATLTPGTDGRWEDRTTFTGLPQTDKNGHEYEYRAVESEPNGYYHQTVTVSKSGDQFTCVISNSLQTVTVCADKKWADQDNKPLSLELMRRIHQLGCLPDIALKVQRRTPTGWEDVSGATLTIRSADILTKLGDDAQKDVPYIVGEKLPKYVPYGASGYVANAETECVYRVLEANADDDSVAYGATAVTPSSGTGRVSVFQTLIMNKISLRKLYFVKNWDDAVNSDHMRPASIALTVTRDPNTPNNAADDETATLTFDAATTSSDPKAAVVASADKHAGKTDGSRWFGELVVPDSGIYSATEAVPVAAGYALKDGQPEHDDTPLASGGKYDWWGFTNTRARKTVDITVKKSWAADGKAVALGDRPAAVLVKLQRKLTADPDAAWADLTAQSSDLPPGGYEASKVLKPIQNETWADVSVSWQGLPAYQTKANPSDERKAYSYRVVEDSTMGYTASVVYDGNTVLNSVDGGADDSSVNAVLTNTLDTVALVINVHWEDHANTASVRPGNVTVKLQRKPAGSGDDAWTDVSTANPTTAPVSTRITPKNGVWSDSTTFTGLPKAAANGCAYEYRVVQTDLPAHYSSTSTLNTPIGSSVTTETITNRFAQWLEIDNATQNPATGATDAGGYVGVNTANPLARDIDPYQMEKLSVSWRPETDWQHAASFEVLYQNNANSAWESIIVSTSDLSELRRARFPHAGLSDSADTRTLTLAANASEMPYRTRVRVTFKPTLAVENTTRSDRGGRVEIKVWSAVADGTGNRYLSFTARGRASSGWMVDMSHLQISVPNGLHSDYSHNLSAVTIKPDGNGDFTASVPVEIAGVAQRVPVRGRVTVLRRDVYSNPIEVSITISPLEFPLDVGVPFKAAAIPGNVPATGDPFVWVLLALLVSGANLALISMLKRRRKRTGR